MRLHNLSIKLYPPNLYQILRYLILNILHIFVYYMYWLHFQIPHEYIKMQGRIETGSKKVWYVIKRSCSCC